MDTFQKCNKASDYSFLAHPPPQKKRTKRPPSLEPTPSFCRSSAFSGIVTWAAHVQPGSPGSLSPHSPYHCSPSVKPICATSVSFLHLTPSPTTVRLTTPPVHDLKADLTAVGYTSVFLQLPHTPISATVCSTVKLPLSDAPKSPTSPTCQSRSLTCFRSLSVLRSRRRSKSLSSDFPTRMKARATAASPAVAKRKKAKYATRPPPFVNELALMQFVNGGSMDDNIRRAMETQAKTTGAIGLADVYRSGEGGIWMDQDEELEYTHLLAGSDGPRLRPTGDLQWVTFDAMSPIVCIPEDERRGSVSSRDSDLDPTRVVQPVDLLGSDDVMLSSSSVVPLETLKPDLSALVLPSQPRRAAKHLHKAEFLVDKAFPLLYASSDRPTSPVSPNTSARRMKPKGKARRRPEPLKLLPPRPASKLPTNSPIDSDKAREDFIENGFKPASAVSVTTTTEVRTRLSGRRIIKLPWKTRAVDDNLMSLGLKTRPSVLNMRGLFRSGRKQDRTS